MPGRFIMTWCFAVFFVGFLRVVSSSDIKTLIRIGEWQNCRSLRNRIPKSATMLQEFFTTPKTTTLLKV